MPKLLIATRNEGKVPEIRHALQGVPFEIVDINDVGALNGYEPEESGSTFEENATIKAKEYGIRAGMLTLADDSGICVDALDGRPGIHSARYAPGSDVDRYNKLLEAIKAVPDERRTAHFTAAIAIFEPRTRKLRTVESNVYGRITRKPMGERPFGYDPIFWYDEAGKTGGQMDVAEKDTYSHRGRALKKAKDILIAEFARN